jgi:hypothetical protein
MKSVLDGEPLVKYRPVPARDPGTTGGASFSQDALMKMIRLYFPRTYNDMKTYDLIMLVSPEYYLFTPKQDQWMYDAIREGAGGLNDASVFSIISGIAESWASSLTQQAFPNDAPAVTAKGAGQALSNLFRIMINRDAPEPILTSFIPFGVEISCTGPSRKVIHRQGSSVLAWQLGNFAEPKVDYLVAWSYEEGRTITSGDFLDTGWFQYPTNPSLNQYSPDIIMNMVLWLTKRNLIQDIEIFHRIKSSFRDYRTRIAILISLKDFIERFGANTGKVQREVDALEEIYDKATEAYLDQDLVEADKNMDDGFARFPRAEEIGREAKDTALLWVYAVEWLVTTSTLFISGTILWTLMVRRRMYRDVKATRLTERAR